MAARTRFLLAYDISDPSRLRRVHDVAKTFGYPLQHSLFVCDLDELELVALHRHLSAEVDHRADRVSIFDLGPPAGRGVTCVQQIGRPPRLPGNAEAEIW
jgi:CRISPR-associated protein Cas2